MIPMLPSGAQLRTIALVATVLAVAVQTHRLTATRDDLAAMTTRSTQAETLLNSCRSRAEDARQAAELAVSAAAAREKAASDVAARQAEKALALARQKAPQGCAEGVAWATAQARAIAQEWQQ